MANLFNRLGQLGVGLAIAGSVASSALYNGKSHRQWSIAIYYVYLQHIYVANTIAMWAAKWNCKYIC